MRHIVEAGDAPEKGVMECVAVLVPAVHIKREIEDARIQSARSPRATCAKEVCDYERQYAPVCEHKDMVIVPMSVQQGLHYATSPTSALR